MKDKKANTLRNALGTYTLPNGQHVHGQLKWKNEKSSLLIHSDSHIDFSHTSGTIYGKTINNQFVTLIKCVNLGGGSATSSNGTTTYHAKTLPHYSVVGNCQFREEAFNIHSIEICSNDMNILFHDFDSFGIAREPENVIDVALNGVRKLRPVEAGDRPIVAYFTGKDVIASSESDFGKITAHHIPNYTIGSLDGVRIKSHVALSITPNSAVNLEQAIDIIHAVMAFISTVAGRIQSIKYIKFSTIDEDGSDAHYELKISYANKGSNSKKGDEPSVGDLPLRPSQNSAEFSFVMSNWLSRHKHWKIARIRYLDCLRRQNSYGADRLVAAANMFDILPAYAFTKPPPVAEHLLAILQEMKNKLRLHPESIDRNSVLDAIGRIGKLSLTGKILQRSLIVQKSMPGQFPDLDFVVRTAVKARNFFVHGSAGGVDMEKLQLSLSFMTDTLEFIFSTSDLIDAGWNASDWAANSDGWGHIFARYKNLYGHSLRVLQNQVGRAQETS